MGGKKGNAKEWEENMKCTRCTENEKRKREMKMGRENGIHEIY